MKLLELTDTELRILRTAMISFYLSCKEDKLLSEHGEEAYVLLIDKMNEKMIGKIDETT